MKEKQDLGSMSITEQIDFLQEMVVKLSAEVENLKLLVKNTSKTEVKPKYEGDK